MAQQNPHPFIAATTTDKIFGCIIGSALGDAVGLYTEFLSKIQSKRAYPDRTFSLVEPVTRIFPDTHRLQFPPCSWTDDTDQALLILLAYLHLKTNHQSTIDLAQEFATRLKIWVARGLPALSRPAFDIGMLVNAVASNPRYLDDPVRCATERWIKSDRKAAPNGSLMRTHPIGVIGVNLTEEQTWRLSVLVGVVRQLLRGQIDTEKSLDAAIERAWEWVRRQQEVMNPGNDGGLSERQIARHLERGEFERHVYAQSLDELKLDEEGKIGYVYKCLGSAIFLLRVAIRRATRATLAMELALKAQLFEKSMVQLVMEGGDADTNGAAAGALLGAYLGYANLPSHWKFGLADNEWLMGKAERLAVAVGVARGELKKERDEDAHGGKK
ncbi:hypothetical protein E8E13_004092 [Curvularia kusanoi]|uniref:ADP-ribosylglycohydrolase n=1 Tax=Curvularia kusanoi TaxID=90978 RepID=A0A9P4T823_CURKU|nr:hypothetical protein E8E13_004092 [Curvularia kusanoi]